jgi:hypothetical protein
VAGWGEKYEGKEMTPAQFREKLCFVIDEAIADKNLSAADVLGALYVIFNNFKLSFEFETIKIARAAEQKKNE